MWSVWCLHVGDFNSFHQGSAWSAHAALSCSIMRPTWTRLTPAGRQHQSDGDGVVSFGWIPKISRPEITEALTTGTLHQRCWHSLGVAMDHGYGFCEVPGIMALRFSARGQRSERLKLVQKTVHQTLQRDLAQYGFNCDFKSTFTKSPLIHTCQGTDWLLIYMLCFKRHQMILWYVFPPFVCKTIFSLKLINIVCKNNLTKMCWFYFNFELRFFCS